jgi:hypothetical protein
VHSRSKHEFQLHAALFWLLLWLLIGPQGKTRFTVAQSDGQHPYLHCANTLASLRQTEKFFCHTVCYFLKTRNTMHALTVVSERLILAPYTIGSFCQTRLWKRLSWLRQALYVKYNTEAHSYNHCCSRKSISVTYSEYVLVALGIQYAMRMCHIVIWHLSDSTIFFHIIS